MRLCLVEDSAVAGLEPLTLTRPAFDLLLGASSLGNKIARAFQIGAGPARRGAVVRPYLAAIQRQHDPHTAVNDHDWLAREPVLVTNSRWVPPTDLTAPADAPSWVGTCEGQPACAYVGPDDAVALEPHGVDSWFEQVAARSTCVELGGEWIHRPWDLVSKNSDHIVRDFTAEARVGLSNRHLATAALVGPAGRLFIHESARIDPYTVFDTTNGPITVSAGAVVQPFTRIEGPSFIGRDTQLFRANLRGGVTLGPNCRIGGEVEQSIVHGFTNKYHEGFLGHAYVGEWVNLGAITSNSDLRNDYAEVFVPLDGDPVATGQKKVGCFLGDHTRTGLGSMMNTGTAVGVMCNLLPAGPLLPKHVPSFTSVLYGRVAPGFPLDQMFATAKIVKGRRGQPFSPVEEQLFLSLYEQTRLERERAFQRAHDRRNDHWPLSAARF
ncbi:MAG TPA: putative sugar nucleotidyl transferase [Isosphaeraceae bacterium]|jgi:UDP-N-acetylglucosamine diphosphorylase/glucosamine-1-phosphate N-acetyltransferase|nr:putative sugar nucleotidyl transferase [Isosphaeraceae bacterium]